ncbi:MAG: hypothetical protein BMS9Abin09_0981 [Gammaproteobacteria bacterium]|nr:MAG: hypothetical protein BMS9Abin09_0981 [Gammaproteobacteria bacterium]
MSVLTAINRQNERPVNQVPRYIWVALLLGLSLQIGWHHNMPAARATADSLPEPPATDLLMIASLGDPVALSKFLNLWLQVFDNQPGISIPFKDLDYRKVRGWLQASMDLDPEGQYPLLAAARLYGEIPDPARQRLMLDFIYKKFLESPDTRWRWLAHSVLIARHRLKDLPLALKYAKALADNATGAQVPHWAQQMDIFVLEELGETEAARIVIGGLLESGQVTDPHELRFLSGQLEQLRDRSLIASE